MLGRPLAIKKLLDDANPSVDLNVGLTVEDVFVDRGKARADGHDQRATVRVIQKPTAHCPERFPSVLQDWEGAVQESKRRRSKTKKEIAKQFSPVLEEDAGLEDTVMQDSPIEQRHRDLPVPSVEAHETTTAGQQEPHSDAIAGTPPLNGLGSEELGSPSPPERQQRPLSQSRKRKQSPEEEEAPVKNPRLEENTRSTQQLAAQSLEPAAEIAPASAPSPLRKRNRIPSFASPHRRRPSISEKPADVHKPGLGLGITKSPSTARTVMLDMPSSQTSLGAPLFPSSAPTAPTLLDQDHGSATKQSQSLQSAMRKNTPVSKSHQRRSVSFANGNDIAQEFQEPQSTPQDGAHLKPSQNTPTDSGTPSSSQIVYPPGFSEEKIQKIRAQVEQEAREIESVNNKLKDPNTDPRCLSPLRQLSDLFAEIKSREGRGKDTRKLRDLRKKLAGPRKKIQMIQKEASEKDSPPSTEPPLPPSASKVDRSIPVTTVNAPSGLDTTPTWSFGSTGKAQSNRRSSVASSNGTHEATSSQHAQPDTSRQKTSENSEAQSTPSASKSPALASRSSPRKPPVKADLQPTPSVMIHTTPLRAPTEASAERQTSRSPAKQREIIEVPSTDDEDDEDEDEDEQDDEEGGNVQNGGKNEQDEQDEDERGEDDEMAERKPATEDQAQELPNEPTKEPVQSLIDDQAEEQDDDEEEEGKEQEDEDEDEDESSGESSDEGEGDKDEAEDGANGVEEQDSDYKDDDDEEGSGSELE